MVQFKPPTVNNFFYFFNLITGNLIVGSIHIALGVILILLYFYELIFNSSASIEIGDIKIEVDQNAKQEHEAFTNTLDIICKLIILVVAVFVTFISIWFVRGIKMCDPSKMKHYLIFQGLFVFLSCCASVVSLDFFVLVFALFELYFFVCAYSLYTSLLTDPNIAQDVVYKNPTAYGYTQAYESDHQGYANGGAGYHPQQQQPDGYYSQEQYYEENEQPQQPQQQYYGGQ